MNTSVTPAALLLRLAVGITFLWAGLAKFASTMEYQPPAAAALANLGVTLPGAPAKKPGEFTADDFKEPVKAMPMYGVALGVQAAASPAPDSAGKPKMQLWPSALATGKQPLIWAWAVAITELVGGGFLLLGILTRFSAFAQGVVMLTAMWLTQFGPAMQSGEAFLYILPKRDPFDLQAWQTGLWQLCLACASFAIVFIGGGNLSMDAILFGVKKPAPLRRPPPKPAV